MAGIHDGRIGKLHQLGAQRIHNLFHGAAPQIGAADAAGEQGISGKKLGHGRRDYLCLLLKLAWCSTLDGGYFFQQITEDNFFTGLIHNRVDRRGSSGSSPTGVMRKIKRNTARRVSRRVNDMGLESAPAQNVALLQQLIDFSELRRADAEEGCLHVHCLVERQIVAVHEHGGAGVLMKFAQAADVIDVRVSADDCFYDELVTAEKIQDAIYFVARVDYQRFARGRIADDGAIALKHPNRDGDVDQTISGGTEGGEAVAHASHYSIGEE